MVKHKYSEIAVLGDYKAMRNLGVDFSPQVFL
jgi:hypothetical protein